MSRLQDIYIKELRPKLMKDLGIKNIMAVPKVLKVTLNMGVGEAVNDKKILSFAVDDMQAIAGQKPLVTKAKKSVASFKIREGWPIGCKVTLRGEKMYEFLDRLVQIYLPRVRDFRGLSGKSFDKQGNYSFGVKEQIIAPEINYDKIDKIRGFDVTITMSANSHEHSFALLKAFDFPIKE